MKIALLASTTLDMLPSLADALARAHGLSLEWYVASFGQYEREVLDPASGARQFAPDVVLLSIDADTAARDAKSFRALASQALVSFPTATIFVHNLVLTAPDVLSLLEWNEPESNARMVAQLNLELSGVALGSDRLRVLDLDRVVRSLGIQAVCSPRFSYLGKIPFNKLGLQAIAGQLVTAINAYRGARRKVLVLDLDGTLWGGVLGEDGIEGLRLSNDGEGKAFYDFQQLLLKLWRSGILLTICSKNDEWLGLEAIRTLRFMVLHDEHFAAHRINWEPKATNIAELAEELQLGLDSFVFLDDSAEERALVRAALPEVLTPDLPKDPSEYPTFLMGLNCFETLKLSTEDRGRGALYVQERRRRYEAMGAVSLEEHLESLQTRVRIRAAHPSEFGRVAQLTQRTNQFNTTGIRRTVDELRSLADVDGWQVLVCEASDRFGDYGLVGSALVAQSADGPIVEGFLLSCRVLGRGVEEAFVAATESLVHQGRGVLLRFVSTNRNAVALKKLVELGFVLDEKTGLFGRVAPMELPKWIELETVSL